MRWTPGDPNADVEDDRGQSGGGGGGRGFRIGGGHIGIGGFIVLLLLSFIFKRNFFALLGGGGGAPGEFAQAYVLAHEIGHHVQKLLGISDKVSAAQERNSSQANALSVKLELQADCFAGVWAHSVKQRSTADSPIAIDENDVES